MIVNGKLTIGMAVAKIGATQDQGYVMKGEIHDIKIHPITGYEIYGVTWTGFAFASSLFNGAVATVFPTPQIYVSWERGTDILPI
jgi:hypothetical protein